MLKIVLAACAASLVLTACTVDDGTGTSPRATPTSSPRVPLSDLEILQDPKSFEGPSTATLASSFIEAPATAPDQKLPVTLTSHDLGGDTKVTVKDTSRVIAMDISGSLAATVWGLGFGDSLVGRDISSQFPGVEKLPLVTTDGHSVNSEAVLALKPTLIITDGSIGPRDVVEQLRDTGVPVVFVQNDPSFAGAAELAEQVATAFGAPAAGKKLAATTMKDVTDVKAQIAKIAPTDSSKKLRMVFLYIRGKSGIYYLFGAESGADDLISGLGGIDIAGEQGWDGMKPMTDEAVVAANPDLILVMTDGLKSAGGVEGLLSTKPAIALTSAGKHRRIVDMADADVLSFGPRSASILDALARAIYAPESTKS